MGSLPAGTTGPAFLYSRQMYGDFDLRFRVSFVGIPLNSVSLIFIVAGGLIFVSGIRAFAALPSVSAASGR